MEKIVFLNSAKVDFDHQLNFSSLQELGTFTKYDASSDEEILERVQNQSVIITKELPLGKDLIEQFPPSVKLICEAGTGYNNIDIIAAANKNITVCNIPGYSTEAVAQLAITFMLNFASSMVLQQNMIKQSNFTNFTKHLQVPHFELQNKTLGVIGTGAIGRQVIKVASALGMNVLAYNRTPKNYEEPNIKSASLEEVLKGSDFVSIHCPLTPDTKHLIDKDKLKLMKPTAFIINTARGPIIKETDLIETLQNNVLAGAALDVQDPEPPALDNPLFAMDNVMLTPHIGWKCFESRERLIQLVSDNIAAFIKGKPINVVG
ncbi:NAD(P)-dependent oxidoreductase [Clostridium formicaceticum]|uniref:Glycerate dehydrogenase n=1 Tax=Clostridium formicaceticum TaxID=1497 RepID=A0AAC9RNK2_9CLOT|nr:NAD(P)-dependent oxidoreductase [Clostridium formicaceticum]AOY74535.1 hydroxyacid dehydrogenase [Clostridium formicaceticum]ARE88892.1 Glycerate dehydrogenase [Clostridium formicaceticum]